MAGVNRYLNLNYHENPINAFVPRPFQQMEAVGRATQHRYDKGLQDVADTANMIKINADPKQQEYANQLMQSYNSQISDLGESFATQGATPENTIKLNKLKKDFINNPDRIQLEKNAIDYSQSQKDVDSLKKEGKYHSMYDTYWGDPNNSETGLQVTKDKVTPFNYKGTQAKGDYIPDMQKLIDHIKSDSGAKEGYRKDSGGNLIVNELGQIQKSDGSWEHITESKVFNLAKTLAPSFLRTKDAQWFIDERTGKPHKDYNNMSYDEKKAYEAEATKEIFRIGSPQIFSNTKQGVDLQNLSEHALGKIDNAQSSSTTPEAISLKDSGNMVNTMPLNISKFYNNKGEFTVGHSVNEPISKDAADKIANMGGWLNMDLSSESTKGEKYKTTVDYINTLFDQSSKILGLSKKEVANKYKEENNKVDQNGNKLENGLNWLKTNVENHYTDLSLQKNTVATLQAPEQRGATNMFLGDKDNALYNIGAGEITDLSGTIQDKKSLISDIRNKDNEQGLYIKSIGFEKPGQLVISDKDSKNLYLNTNYETLKKLTKPAVEINLGSENYLKTFELTEQQKQNLDVKNNIAPKLETYINTNNGMIKIAGEAIDRHTYPIGDVNYDVMTIISRSLSGKPETFVNVTKVDNSGNRTNETMTLNDYKTFTANQVIASPEFNSINKEKKKPIEFIK